MQGTRHPDATDVARLSSLDDELRSRLYGYVRSQREPVSRDQAAEAVGISRSLAAYHLDKLTDAGLLAVDYQRPAGRGGPGAGRPAKVYARTDDEFTVSVPPRDYELLARLLVESTERDQTGSVRTAVGDAAADAGRKAAEQARAALPADPSSDEVVVCALHAVGYEPDRGPDGNIELRNCPFHRLAREHPETVCGLNLELIRGVLQQAPADPDRAQLRPRPDRCCVVVLADKAEPAPA
jgi:predicted ArsR family transcriptional regulator